MSESGVILPTEQEPYEATMSEYAEIVGLPEQLLQFKNGTKVYISEEPWVKNFRENFRFTLNTGHMAIGPVFFQGATLNWVKENFIDDDE